MGEVDELDDPVDHRVAEGDEGVDGAVGESEDENLGELARVDDSLRGEEHDGGKADHEETEVADAHAEAAQPQPSKSASPGYQCASVQRLPPSVMEGGGMKASSLVVG